MFSVARKMVNDEDVVSDIIQDVFLYLNEQLNKGKKIQYPKSWLYRATTNKCIDHLKENKRFFSLESVPEKTESESNTLDEKQRVKHVIELALEQLDVHEKILAVLYSEGLSYKEIAEVANIKLTSVGKTLSRVLKKLEVELKKEHYELY